MHVGKIEATHRPRGAVFVVRGADLSEDNLVGSGYGIIICDEYALWRKPELVKLQLAPMLADYGGQFIFGSTKRGKNHFYDLHQLALSRPEKYWVEEAIIDDNTFIDEKGKSIVLEQYTGTEDPLYRQEINNEYVTFQGMVFALDVDDYTNKRMQRGDLDHCVHIRGVDHGFSPDPTACVWLAYNDKAGYWQVYNEYKQSALLIHQHAEVIQKQEPYTFNETISDIDPQLIAEYAAIGLSMEPAGKYDKQSRLLRLVNALKTGKLKIADNCVELLKEMSSYEWEQDGNDHLIDALIYAYTNASEPEKRIEEPEEDLRRRKELDLSQDFG
jgi:phage terminase large subunit